VREKNRMEEMLRKEQEEKERIIKELKEMEKKYKKMEDINERNEKEERILFMNNPTENEVKIEGNKLTVSKDRVLSFFIDQEINEGIWRMFIKYFYLFIYLFFNYFFFFFLN
jgi:hypothetical protein